MKLKQRQTWTEMLAAKPAEVKIIIDLFFLFISSDLVFWEEWRKNNDDV